MQLQLRNDNIRQYMNESTQLLAQLGNANHSVISYDQKRQLFWEQIKHASIMWQYVSIIELDCSTTPLHALIRSDMEHGDERMRESWAP